MPKDTKTLTPEQEKERAVKRTKEKRRKRAFLAADASYKLKLTEEEERIQELKEHGYIPLFISDNIANAKESSYRCVVFVNPKKKKVLFANAGTRIGKFGTKAAAADLYDDARLGLGLVPTKFESAQQINDHVLELLQHYPTDPESQKSTDISQWKFEYVGHSLGAVMARLQAADMQMKLLDRRGNADNITSISDKADQVSSKIFDAPSYAKVVSKVIQQHNKKHGTDYKINDVIKPKRHETFQARSNLVTLLRENDTLKSQNGSVYEVIRTNEKGNFLDKFMKSKVGKSVWKLTQKCIKNLETKAQVAGVSVGASIGLAVGGTLGLGIGAPIGALIGGAIGFGVVKLSEKILKSDTVQNIWRGFADSLPAINETIKSHSLGNFAGVDEKDSNSALVKIISSGAVGKKFGSYSTRLMEHDEKLFQKLEALESRDRNKRKIRAFELEDPYDLESSTEENSLSKFKRNRFCRQTYFMYSEDGTKLIRCSRKMVVDALILIKKEELEAKKVRKDSKHADKDEPEQKSTLLESKASHKHRHRHTKPKTEERLSGTNKKPTHTEKVGGSKKHQLLDQKQSPSRQEKKKRITHAESAQASQTNNSTLAK